MVAWCTILSYVTRERRNRSCRCICGTHNAGSSWTRRHHAGCVRWRKLHVLLTGSHQVSLCALATRVASSVRRIYFCKRTIATFVKLNLRGERSSRKSQGLDSIVTPSATCCVSFRNAGRAYLRNSSTFAYCFLSGGKLCACCLHTKHGGGGPHHVILGCSELHGVMWAYS